MGMHNLNNQIKKQLSVVAYNAYCKETILTNTFLHLQVVNKLCSTIRGENVAIVNDRYFTSVNLLATLNYACVGTIMSNRRNLPEMKEKLQRGQSIASCSNNGLICYKWQDTKEVIKMHTQIFKP